MPHKTDYLSLPLSFFLSFSLARTIPYLLGGTRGGGFSSFPLPAGAGRNCVPSALDLNPLPCILACGSTASIPGRGEGLPAPASADPPPLGDGPVPLGDATLPGVDRLDGGGTFGLGGGPRLCDEVVAADGPGTTRLATGPEVAAAAERGEGEFWPPLGDCAAPPRLSRARSFADTVAELRVKARGLRGGGAGSGDTGEEGSEESPLLPESCGEGAPMRAFGGGCGGRGCEGRGCDC